MPQWTLHKQAGRQKLTLDLTPAAERPDRLLPGLAASGASVGQPPDSPAYRSGVDIDFLRQHDIS